MLNDFTNKHHLQIDMVGGKNKAREEMNKMTKMIDKKKLRESELEDERKKVEEIQKEIEDDERRRELSTASRKRKRKAVASLDSNLTLEEMMKTLIESRKPKPYIASPQ